MDQTTCCFMSNRDAQRQTIWFTVVKIELGKMLIAATLKGVCAVSLHSDENVLKSQLQDKFHTAVLIEGGEDLNEWTQALILYLEGQAPWPMLPYDIQATAFQKKVWGWLRATPPGKTFHYEEVAKAIGKPSAARAVARACASNPVALVIPCHRIIPKAGGIGGYRWEPERKKRLLELEAGLLS